MKANVGRTDKFIRMVLGLVLLSFYFIVEGGLKWVSLLGVVLLITAFANWCPLYLPFGISTCKRK